METIEEFLLTIKQEEHRSKMKEVLEWVKKQFPNLNEKIAWKQPMFTDHGTFIIAFSASKQHFSVSPEQHSIKRFTEEIEKAGYSCGSNLFRIKWEDAINYELLENIINYNIEDKKDCSTFWRS